MSDGGWEERGDRAVGENVFKLALALGAMLAVGWCARSAPSDPAPELSAEHQAIAMAVQAKLALEERLRDPDSVRYRSVMAKRGVACGLFSAKNGFGGYGDAERFVAIGIPITTVYLAADAEFAAKWNANCLSTDGFVRID